MRVETDPFAKTTPRPWIVERHDQEDGSTNYEIWAQKPPTYERICTVSENFDSMRARVDAALIVAAVNAYGHPTELERELTVALRELIAFYTRALVLTKIDHGAMGKARAVLSKATERGL